MLPFGFIHKGYYRSYTSTPKLLKKAKLVYWNSIFSYVLTKVATSPLQVPGRVAGSEQHTRAEGALFISWDNYLYIMHFSSQHYLLYLLTHHGIHHSGVDAPGLADHHLLLQHRYSIKRESQLIWLANNKTPKFKGGLLQCVTLNLKREGTFQHFGPW